MMYVLISRIMDMMGTVLGRTDSEREAGRGDRQSEISGHFLDSKQILY